LLTGSAKVRAARAMLADFAPPTRGRVFGFHRAMDHAGPSPAWRVATAFLYFYPGNWDAFSLTIIPGIIVILFILRFPNRAKPSRTPRNNNRTQ
jgi:hypothetical protein